VPGRFWLALTAGLLAVSFFRSINLLLLLGYLMVGVLVVNALRAGRRLKHLRATRRLDDLIFAGSPLRVEVRVDNQRRTPQPGLRLEDAAPEQTQRWFLPQVKGRQGVDVRHRVVLRRRGRWAWGPLTAVSGYPFGLVERRLQLLGGEEVLVLPAVGGVHRGLLRHYLRSQGNPDERQRHRPRVHPTAQTEVHGVRSYRSGDNPRLIHWRTTARRGELMVRELEDVPSDNLLVILDPTLAAEEDAAEHFEDAVCLAATLCWEWCRHPGDRLVLALGGVRAQVIDGLTSPWHARRTLEALAVLESCPPGPSDLVSRLGGLSRPSLSVVLIAVGASDLAGPLEQTLQRPVNGLDARWVGGYAFYEPPEMRS
jgi:uncharacterized protein (DUF58 family)